MKKVLFLALLGTIGLWISAKAFAAHSERGCIRCHMPHHAGNPADPKAYGVPLWSTMYNADGIPEFTLYSSKTFTALETDITQPDGASKLCLGCHDGSYSRIGAGSKSRFGTGDLARSHPVSFTYNAALAGKVPGGTLRDPAVMSGFGKSITEDLLDSRNKMQCTSCHNVHVTPDIADNGVMLRWDIEAVGGVAAMCNTCHNK
jgi:hypothetical protein